MKGQTMHPSIEVLKHELRTIGARLNEIQGISPWQPSPNHPVHGAEVARLNRRSVQIIRELERRS